jgi:hypothetical protein
VNVISSKGINVIIKIIVMIIVLYYRGTLLKADFFQLKHLQHIIDFQLNIQLIAFCPVYLFEPLVLYAWVFFYKIYLLLGTFA